MRTTIDNAGRIVVPKSIRDRLGLEGGCELDLVEVDGVLEIKPVPIAAHKVLTEDGPVIASASDHPPMTDADLRGVLERIRR